MVRLGEVANVVMRQSPPGNSYNEIGEGFLFLQGKTEFGSLHPKHIKYTTILMKLAPKNSILLSVRAPVGDTNIADIEYCIGRGLSSVNSSFLLTMKKIFKTIHLFLITKKCLPLNKIKNPLPYRLIFYEKTIKNSSCSS
ncbi:MAG: hypothetical protein KBG25_04885 [Paludibacteraceae bacterium]|nr:hypothetical protein [Paludibacteraceae bacterium]